MHDVLVVGGGIVGAAVAVQCARRGMSVLLCERGALAGGASALPLALLPADEDASDYLQLHHFSGGAFLLDRTLPDDWSARRIDPSAAALALVGEARSYGAEIMTHCDVKGLLVRGRTVRGALTDAGELRAGTTVVAAGTGAWRICRGLRTHVPVRAEALDLLVTEPAPFELERPVVSATAWVAQDEAGRVVAADPDRAADLVPELRELAVLDRRTISAPVAADGQPLEGPLESVSGLVLACGHGFAGVARAPSAGAKVAALVASGPG